MAAGDMRHHLGERVAIDADDRSVNLMRKSHQFNDKDASCHDVANH